MSDNKKNTGSPDNKRINQGEDYEMRDWAKSFGVSEKKLQNAIDAVGSSAEKVGEYLKEHKSSNSSGRSKSGGNSGRSSQSKSSGSRSRTSSARRSTSGSSGASRRVAATAQARRRNRGLFDSLPSWVPFAAAGLAIGGVLYALISSETIRGTVSDFFTDDNDSDDLDAMLDGSDDLDNDADWEENDWSDVDYSDSASENAEDEGSHRATFLNPTSRFENASDKDGLLSRTGSASDSSLGETSFPSRN